MIHLQTASDADILAGMYVADAALGLDVSMDLEIAAASAQMFYAEIDRRFGEGANDRLADYCTATHATHTEMIQMARIETGLLVEIANGTHACGDGPNARMKPVGAVVKPSEQPQSWRCQCGKFWVKWHGTFYENAADALAAQPA